MSLMIHVYRCMQIQIPFLGNINAINIPLSLVYVCRCCFFHRDRFLCFDFNDFYIRM